MRVHHPGRNEEGEEAPAKISLFQRFLNRFNEWFHRMLERYEALAKRVLVKPGLTAVVILAGVAAMLLIAFRSWGGLIFRAPTRASL